MAHLDGGKGNTFPVKHSFEEVLDKIGEGSIQFESTTGTVLTAKAGFSRQGHRTITIRGKKHAYINVCPACWGFRLNCHGTRIGHAIEPLATNLNGSLR